MGKKYDSKKIASSPALKKRIARFCAEFDANIVTQSPKETIQELLFSGHRGFISLSEDALFKEFDYRMKQISSLMDEEEKRMSAYDTWTPDSRHMQSLAAYHKAGTEIGDEIFEDKVLKS